LLRRLGIGVRVHWYHHDTHSVTTEHGDGRGLDSIGQAARLNECVASGYILGAEELLGMIPYLAVFCPYAPSLSCSSPSQVPQLLGACC
jgi:hypothetical protein